MTAIHWLNPISGSFTNGADWSGGVAPGRSDDAILDAAGGDYTVKVSGDVLAWANTIQTAVNATLEVTAGSLFIAEAGTGSRKGGGGNAGSIVVDSEGDIEIGGGFKNTGSVILNQSDFGVRENATLFGGGQVMLEDGTISGSGTALINVDNTISGSGFLDEVNFGAFQLINQAKGVIAATDKSLALTIDIGAGSLINAGLIEATNKATLAIDSGVIDDSAGGTLLAGAHSAITLGQTDIIGGVLDTEGDGVITTSGQGLAELDGASFAVRNKGRLVVGDGQSLAIEGVIVNSGRIDLDGAADTTLLRILPTGATLGGGGKVVMRSRFAEIAGLSGGALLTNEDGEILGRGRLGAGKLQLVNAGPGVIAGTTGGVLTIDTGNHAVINDGLIASRGSGEVVIKSAVANDGALEADAGTLTVMGAVSGGGSGVVAGGTLAFAAAFDEAVDFETAGGVLGLAQSQSYNAAISGFSAVGATTLDLSDIGFVAAGEASYAGTATSGVLTVTDGTHTASINLIGDYLGATFTAASDGHGGTSVTASSPGARPPAPHPAPTHGLISAMAALHAPAGEMNSRPGRRAAARRRSRPAARRVLRRRQGEARHDVAKSPAKADPATDPAWRERLAHYERLIATIPGLERKGATVPYTSLNGNMSSYLHASGVVALRLPPAEREALIGGHGARLMEAYGVVQKEYVAVPDALLADTEALAPYFRASHDHVAGLKAKPTTRKKAAR